MAIQDRRVVTSGLLAHRTGRGGVMPASAELEAKVVIAQQPVAAQIERPATYVVVKAKGGMGNRMLCAVTGIAYGNLTGRQVLVDWSDATYSNDGTNVFSRYFSSPSVTPTGGPLPTQSIRPAVWKDNLQSSVSKMIERHDPQMHNNPRIHRKYSVDPRALKYAEDVVVIWAYTHQIPAIRRHLHARTHESWPKDVDGILRKLLQEQLRLQPAIRRRISEFKDRQWGDVIIGVHLRHTDRTAKVVRYLNAVRRLIGRWPRASIFLATDNRRVLDLFTNTFRRVISTDKWYPNDPSSMHQNPACPDRYLNGVEALTDMYLLAECDYLVYPGGSTFSYISGLLSNAPSRRLIDLERFDVKVRAKRLLRSWM